jgi:hypothetical protein
LGKIWPNLRDQLAQLGLAEPAGAGGWRIGYPDLVRLRAEHEIDALEELAEPARWWLQVESRGTPGAADFRYMYTFYAGREPVYPRLIGCFAFQAERVWRLDAEIFAVTAAIDAFAELPTVERVGARGLIEFGKIRGLAEEVGATLDALVRSERILVPSELGLDVIAEPGGRMSLAPLVDGVDRAEMRRAFFASDDAEEVYSLDDGRGGRVRVVLRPPQREAVRRMLRARHLGGGDRDSVARDPRPLFDGVQDVITLRTYGERVRAIGDFPFAARPYLQRSSTGIFDDPDRPECGGWHSGLQCTYGDGSVESLPFGSPGEARRFCSEVAVAAKKGLLSLEWEGKTIPMTPSLVSAAADLEGRLGHRGGGSPPPVRRPGRYLLILTNDGSLDYTEASPPGSSAAPTPQIPRALVQQPRLMPHQQRGIAWMQQGYLAGKRGCLLADDMGLGKTLQALTFLAWLIERGDVAAGKDAERPPWRPALIVAPLVLLESHTWTDAMEGFFEASGAVFQPWEVLHGAKLREFRATAGSETEIGRPVLDLEKLRQRRVLLTNYDTVSRYQHSFAALKDSISLLIADEAQEAKTPNTKISHALKSLAPRFRLACTGTPVETTLLDVWNIMDLLQPGLLGSAKDFGRTYECDQSSAAERLRERLGVSRPGGWVLRREKADVLGDGLPPKIEEVLSCELSQQQRQAHLDQAAALGRIGEGGHPFQVIHRLMQLYQHPRLLPRFEPAAPRELVECCPKLRVVIDRLKDVRRRREKVLIFTRTLNMQQILKSVIEAEFGGHVGIINGSSGRGETGNARSARTSALQEFKTTAGFAALVLSPDVAGMGLDICEANHVIHYGRWWNPAKESQATDRVYRIGQSKPVYVYYPIARDPRGEIKSFDEKLHDLIQRRRRLAADFLAPMPAEDELAQELVAELAGTGAADGDEVRLAMPDVLSLDWREFEALTAALEAKRGARVALTPCGGDDGADVVSLFGSELRLIQCKHLANGEVAAEAVAQVRCAVDIYRHRYLGALAARCSISPILVTNQAFTRQARRAAREQDVQLVAAPELEEQLRRFRCTRADIAFAEAQRVSPGGLRQALGAW